MSLLLTFKLLRSVLGLPNTLGSNDWQPANENAVSAYDNASVNVVTDTRALQGNNESKESHERNKAGDNRSVDVFCALKGQNFDGHDYLSGAFEAGVRFFICSCKASLESLRKVTTAEQEVLVFLVKDSEKALQDIARACRERYSYPVISLTGSSGKTTVKEWATAMLEQNASVLKTEGNFNNELGVPFTLFRLKDSHNFAVIEAGAGKRGDIALLADIIRPTIALVNNIQEAHLQGFGSRQAIADEKGALYESKNLKYAVVNLESNFREHFEKRIAANVQQVKLIGFTTNIANIDGITCSESGMAQYDLLVFSRNMRVDSRGCCAFDLVIHDQNLNRYEQFSSGISIQLNVPGKHQVANALATVSLAVAAGINAADVATGLQNFSGVAGRMRLHKLAGFTLVDDSYNANPGSVRAAIDYLASCSMSWLVLGDMAELGEKTMECHEQIGAYAKGKISRLYSVGSESKHAQKAYLDQEQEGAPRRHFDDKKSLLKQLNLDLKTLKNNAANDSSIDSSMSPVLLIKGSRSAGLEKLVEAIVEEREAC